MAAETATVSGVRVRYAMSGVMLGLVALTVAMVALAYWDGLKMLVHFWETKEEYSHAYLLPVLSAFLVWQKKNELSASQWNGSWLGVGIVAVGALLLIVGSMATIYAVMQYALIVSIAGCVLALLGIRNLPYIWAAIVLLFFTIPFPQFLYQALSTKLQLVSSELGVAVIRAFGVSVFLEGNVIDLGSFKLQVVEACNGLRYLFPLASFGFLCAYLYRGPVWQKVIIFLSTIPITVFMNSFRIGVIGYTVDRWGQQMAEGFLHDFEGWAIFMACLVVLFAEIAALARLQRPRKTFAESFFVEIPAPLPPANTKRHIPPQFVASLAVVLLASVGSYAIGTREEQVPARSGFMDFPLKIADWSGQPEVMEQIYVDALKFTDYLLVNYKDKEGKYPINFYVAYYESQKAGESAHSPRSCIPGGGWKIEDLSQILLEDVPSAGHSQSVNRVQIAMGENKQLVYYWFQQRGRIITNEYLVKWYLLWDSLLKSRTDGALVRVTTFIPPGETWASGDSRLRKFLKDLGPALGNYVPD